MKEKSTHCNLDLRSRRSISVQMADLSGHKLMAHLCERTKASRHDTCKIARSLAFMRGLVVVGTHI